MQEYVINRPDEEAMEQILQKNFDNAAGAVLRLAWQAGLLRDEIQRLSWAQIDFLDGCIVLPDRRVPIPEDLSAWLSALREGRNRCSEVVVLSDRDKKPLTPQSISRLAGRRWTRRARPPCGSSTCGTTSCCGSWRSTTGSTSPASRAWRRQP